MYKRPTPPPDAPYGLFIAENRAIIPIRIQITALAIDNHLTIFAHIFNFPEVSALPAISTIESDDVTLLVCSINFD